MKVRVLLQKLTRPSVLNGTWQKDQGIRKELLEKDQIHYMELGTWQTLLNKDFGNKKDVHCPDYKEENGMLISQMPLEMIKGQNLFTGRLISIYVSDYKDQK